MNARSKTRFAELLGRSCFSFLDGASQPDELVLRSRDLGHQAIALCDRDGLYGSVRMHEASVELEHRVLVGAELTIERGAVYSDRPYPCVALLVEDHQGYTSLCRLLTHAHAEHEKGEAGIDIEAIASEAQGLFALVPLEVSAPLHPSELDRLREAFGERCAIATWRHLAADDDARIRAALAASEHHRIPIVATNRPRYHHRARKPLADVVQCIRLGVTLDEAGARLAPNAEAELKSGEVMARLFPRHPEWIERSVDIAERARFSLDQIRYRFPSEYGAPDRSPDENLRIAVEEGIRDRYPEGCPDDVRGQIAKELSLIAELEVAPYFSSVQQIVKLARDKSILCQGRGSAANSAVCYVLGITAVDPARSSLLFERFMSSARHEPPDIDVDFEHERREEVIQEIYERYGRDRAAMVSEVICYRGRSALREVGKVFGLATDQLDRLSSVAGFWSEVRPEALERRGLDPRDRGMAQVIRLAGELEGFPRHLSIHVGGFVLSAEPLDGVAPVEPGRMEGRTVIPWDKDDIEALGFFKVDVLGLGMLTAIRKALAHVHRRSNEDLQTFDPIDALARIPPEDPTVYDAVCQADTIGVFQIESRAQMAMLPLLKPRCFYDLVVEVGIVRPGPIQGKMVHPYLRRRCGEEPVAYPHPTLQPILERTLGVPLFQEQVMQIAIVGAGYSPSEADQLRRDMAAWRKNGKLARHRDKLLGGFRERGVANAFGERLYQQIQGFGEYGFPECVVGETLVLDASTGRRVAIEDVVSGRVKLRTTIACDAHLRLRKRRVLAATPSGAREVFRLRTALGRELIATPEHPLLTISGWRPLASLRPGDHVAAARKLPTLGGRRWRRHEIIALADLVAEREGHPLRTCEIRASRGEMRRSSSSFLQRSGKKTGDGSCCGERAFPDEVFELHVRDVALLLARLWEGHLSSSYDTVSHVLAEQVQHLLLRLGIVSRVDESTLPDRDRHFTVTVMGDSHSRNADAEDVYWDRVVSVEPLGVRETYDLTIEGEANFLANDFVVHNSHAASFALLVYASSWLKVKYPAAFACALVNSQPMGFYSPASIVRDAQRHGVEVRPARVDVSEWDCTLEPAFAPEGGQALRLGLRLVRGLGEASAQAIVKARGERAFESLDDFVERVGLRRDELELLAEAGALEGLRACRREALWRLRAPREAGLFDGQTIESDELVGLPPVSRLEQLTLDYETTTISLHDHPMRHVRARLGSEVLEAAEQSSWKQDQRVTVAGVVLTRQRPMTAKGIVFVTIEDETGVVNLVVYPDVFERYELAARHAGMLLARGKVDRRGEVVHVRVQHLERIEMPHTRPLVIRSRDFH